MGEGLFNNLLLREGGQGDGLPNNLLTLSKGVLPLQSTPDMVLGISSQNSRSL